MASTISTYSLPLGPSYRRMDNLFDLMKDFWIDDPVSTAGQLRTHRSVWKPTEDGWEIATDVPGIPPEALDIQIRDGVVSVRADNNGRSVNIDTTLPKGADAQGVRARLEHGVLTLVAPRSESDKPRKISLT